MGTSYSLAVYSDEDTQNTFSRVSNILENVNQEMSTYIVNSSISHSPPLIISELFIIYLFKN